MPKIIEENVGPSVAHLTDDEYQEIARRISSDPEWKRSVLRAYVHFTDTSPDLDTADHGIPDAAWKVGDLACSITGRPNTVLLFSDIIRLFAADQAKRPS